MKNIIAILTLLFLTIFQNVFGQMKPDWQFRSEYMAHLLAPKDTIYIEDRHHLEKFSVSSSNDSKAILNYTAKSGDKISINILTGKFEPSKHNLHINDTVFKSINNEKQVDHIVSKDLIDGTRAYGIDGGFPLKEIKELKIKWNDKWLAIPDSAFKNLFEIHPTTIEAYISKDKTLIYLYISASDGAGSYSVKFVFDKKNYITRIVNTNECTNGFDFLDALPLVCE